MEREELKKIEELGRKIAKMAQEMLSINQGKEEMKKLLEKSSERDQATAEIAQILEGIPGEIASRRRRDGKVVIALVVMYHNRRGFYANLLTILGILGYKNPDIREYGESSVVVIDPD